MQKHSHIMNACINTLKSLKQAKILSHTRKHTFISTHVHEKACTAGAGALQMCIKMSKTVSLNYVRYLATYLVPS